MAADKASMGLHITAVIHDVVSSFADKGAYALKDSRYAPGNREVSCLTFGLLIFTVLDPRQTEFLCNGPI